MNRWAVAARAWAISALATCFAVLGHSVAGGAAPSLWGPVLSTAVGSVIALPLMGRRPSWLRSLGLFVPAQLAYHMAFSSVGEAHGAAGITRAADHASHSMTHTMTMDGMSMAMPGMGMDPAAAASATDAHGGLLMLTAHLAAALVSAAAARWGESLLLRLRLSLEIALTSALLVLRGLAPTPRPAPRPRAPRTSRRPGLVNRGTLLRFRGPPARA